MFLLSHWLSTQKHVWPFVGNFYHIHVPGDLTGNFWSNMVQMITFACPTMWSNQCTSCITNSTIMNDTTTG
jgi:hypothetical protein